MYIISPYLEKAMAPHFSTLAWKIPWTEEPCRLQSMGSLESDTTERLHFHFSLSCIGEGNSNPLQCSCLENPRDGEAWWAAVYGVSQSRTQLKRLSSSSITILDKASLWQWRCGARGRRKGTVKARKLFACGSLRKSPERLGTGKQRNHGIWKERSYDSFIFT